MAIRALRRSASIVNILTLLIVLGKNIVHLSWSFQPGLTIPYHARSRQKCQRSRNDGNKHKMHHVLKLSSTESDVGDSIVVEDTVPAVLSIEYCTGCRWLLRSTWLMQELFTTFNNEMTSITLIPSKPPSPGGIFEIKLNEDIIWDRKVDNGFPEAKELKQRVRDKIAPKKSLGHSDVDYSKSSSEASKQQNSDCIECEDNSTDTKTKGKTVVLKELQQKIDDSSSGNNVKITYCTGCRWMLRSAWMCQELLTTFETDLTSVTLIPGYDASGIFEIHIDDNQIWDRKIDNGFPDIKILKQRVRDLVDPSRNLGHVDNDGNTMMKDDAEDMISDKSDIDDEDAEELRRFYGVM